jgi:hypothetical protein
MNACHHSCFSHPHAVCSFKRADRQTDRQTYTDSFAHWHGMRIDHQPLRTQRAEEDKLEALQAVRNRSEQELREELALQAQKFELERLASCLPMHACMHPQHVSASVVSSAGTRPSWTLCVPCVVARTYDDAFKAVLRQWYVRMFTPVCTCAHVDAGKQLRR